MSVCCTALSLTNLQIFQQLSKDTIAAPGVPSSMAILEAQSAPVTGKDTKARGRDSSLSAVAGASILASLTTFSKRLSQLSPSKGNDEDSAVGSLSGESDNGICDVDMNDSMELQDYPGPSLNQKELGPVSDENINAVDVPKDTVVDTEEGAVPGSNNELRPLLQLLSRSSTSDFDFSGNLSKLLDEQRQIRDLLKDLDRPTFVSTRRQAFKDTLRKAILTDGDIDVSMESFPYYLRLVTLPFCFMLTFSIYSSNLDASSAVSMICVESSFLVSSFATLQFFSLYSL